jgi:hypothetical protein
VIVSKPMNDCLGLKGPCGYEVKFSRAISQNRAFMEWQKAQREGLPSGSEIQIS